jgi:hypothetical protein
MSNLRFGFRANAARRILTLHSRIVRGTNTRSSVWSKRWVVAQCVTVTVSIRPTEISGNDHLRWSAGLAGHFAPDDEALHMLVALLPNTDCTLGFQLPRPAIRRSPIFLHARRPTGVY